MISDQSLKELIVFSRQGTLAKTAASLNLTEPAITHALKKLEAELQVKLFIRRQNKIYLTETGKFTARQAQTILAAKQKFIKQVHHFEQNERFVTVAANAPGPLIVLHRLADSHLLIKKQFVATNFRQMLLEKQITCLLINHPLTDQSITAVYLGTENMSVNLPQNDPLAHYPSLTYKMLAGRTIMSPQAIGFWQNIYQQQVPNGKFIYQKEDNDYSEILKYSALPFFTTNLTHLNQYWVDHLPQNRINLPLTDAIAHQKFYACFLKENARRLRPLVTKLQQQWAKVN